METGKYSILGILEFINLDQFIIPEIQRDYVWEVENVLDLLQSLQEGFGGEKKDVPYLGFIYAYHDKDYVYKYFLVDGQQRMTTIFLLLLACHQKLGKKLPDYLLKQGKLKLDYKVRQASHDFLIDFVNHCNNASHSYSFLIKEQAWFHKQYEIDKTIINLVGNYNAIREWIDKNINDTSQFLKFIEDDVRVSYFNIQESRQGEELYIYMNSRGRQLEPNETLKAKYLSKLKDQTEKEQKGIEWEKWQDFFWKNRERSPDADAGFNDFLQMVQIINMCSLGDDISGFVGGRSNQAPDFTSLPNSIEKIEKYFLAYEWLVNSKGVSEFFEKYEGNRKYFSSSSGINFGRKQIFYLRTLPIIAFIAETGVRDDDTIIRFIRFFYNISRKDSTVGKDISSQLPNAIKLMLEYANSKKNNFDVCDLISYSKGRKVLINDEEVFKLYIYKTPPKNSTREAIEYLFWDAEDHFVFNGEIDFLLNRYLNKETFEFDIDNYKKTWTVFENLFNKKQKETYALVSRTLLYYGNTWIEKTPNYYSNYNCQDWYSVVRHSSGKYLMELLEDMYGKASDYLDIIIKRKTRDYFKTNNFNSIDSLQPVEELFEQVRILAAIDYYSEKIIWKEFSYIATDDKYTSESYNDVPFFNNDRVIYNIKRYISDGLQGRIIPAMNAVLQDDIKLKKVIKEIINFTDSE